MARVAIPVPERKAPQDKVPSEVAGDDYDALTDIRESVRVGLAAIRARVRSGGKGWSGGSS
jgi:hypothetical protein